MSGALPQTGRVMVKDEDVCVHCGLCAERCPTAAWDMQKFELKIPHAGNVAATATWHGTRTARSQRSGRQGSYVGPARARRQQAGSRQGPRAGRRAHQRLRAQARERQRHRLGERERPADAGDLPDGDPGFGQEPVPVQHPGAADLVRGSRQQERPRVARARLRPGGRDERGDLRPRRQGGPLGRLAALRLELAAGRVAVAPRRHLPGRAARADVQRDLQGLARADPDEEHRLPGRAGGAARHRHARHRRAARREVLQEEGAARVEPQGAALRLRLREGAPRLPAADPAREDARDRRPHPDRRQHRDRARLRVRGRHGGRLVPDHAVDVGDGRVQGVLHQLPARSGDAARTTSASCRRRTSWRRSAW